MAAVVVAVLMSGCSSEDPARAKERQEDYCTKLGSWQKAGRAVADAGADARSPEAEDVASVGDAAVRAAKRLDRDGIAPDIGSILDDTVAAIAGDSAAEGRAASYCSDSGFETLVDAAG